ncbi:MAG: TIM barrel protein [Clostridia bacterium]|nr:TIM barrel protein [Clostridia bacterium]
MSIVLGVNHQFIFTRGMTDPVIHTETLKEAAAYPEIDALDCWTWPEARRAKEESRILKDSGKWINYNIGDRPGDEPCFPGSPDPARRERAYDILMREFDHAMDCGARKIILGSGPDVPEDRETAKRHFAEILVRVGKNVPRDVTVAVEPTDRDVDKHFLLGPAKETADFLHDVQAMGLPNAGMLLDMCHIPIMHETLESAVKNAGDTIRHIHLGNCIIKDPLNPFYGDKHVAWGAEGSEYGEKETAIFAGLLKNAGYLDCEHATVTFEMRRAGNLDAKQSLQFFIDIWNRALAAI